MKNLFMPVVFCLCCHVAFSQLPTDTVTVVGKKSITLSELVVNNNLNVPRFIEQIKNDTSFYKAFRNLHIVGFTAINDFRMLDKKGNLQASFFSRTKQHRNNNCRSMQTIEEQVTGDMYNDNHEFNYYTARMFASLFFTKDTICGEDNIVAGRSFSTRGMKGMEKHKEQLKMLFFNPGKKIKGLPFMSNKTAIYDDELAEAYDMEIDMDFYNGVNCFIFHQKVKPGSEDEVIVDEMTTWFDQENMEVVARTYSLSYRAAVYDFNVQMEVQMIRFNGLSIPSLVRYIGNWKAITKRRERAVFTSTLSDFK